MGKWLNFVSKKLYDVIMEKYWICPHCLSNKVVKRVRIEHWLDRNDNDITTREVEQANYLYFYCVDCDNEFDCFEPQGNYFRDYSGKGVMKYNPSLIEDLGKLWLICRKMIRK